jgi:hypothetical protein
MLASSSSFEVTALDALQKPIAAVCAVIAVPYPNAPGDAVAGGGCTVTRASSGSSYGSSAGWGSRSSRSAGSVDAATRPESLHA